MKPIIFEIPATEAESITVQEDHLPYFYNQYHKHEQIQITAILSGSGSLITKNGHFRFEPGQLFIFGTYAPHLFQSDPIYLQNIDMKSCHAYHVYFKARLVEDNGRIPEFDKVKRFLDKIGTGLKLNTERSAFFIEKIRDIHTSKGLLRVFRLFEFLQYCYFNIDEFSHLHTSKKAVLDLSYSSKARIQDIYVYTLAHFTKPITLEKIAKVANMSIPAVCSYFKKVTRMTYMDFLKELRIDYACGRIVKDDFSSISEVAYASGFNSLITFNRAFKSITGKTPTQYINEHKKTVREQESSKFKEDFPLPKMTFR